MGRSPDQPAPAEAAPEYEAAAERHTVSSFLQGMAERQPRVVDGTLTEVARELSASTGGDVRPDDLRQRLQKQLTGGVPDLGPEQAVRFDRLIRSEEMKPQSVIWQENPNAPSMLGRVARSHREGLKEMLCEVLAADIRSEEAA